MNRQHLSVTGATAILLAVCFTSTAFAQMPAEIAAQVKAIGPVVDPAKTAPIYAPLQTKEPYEGVKVTRDVKYGSDARNLLDVFMPENASGPLPVFVFVHGGAFMGGNKRTGDSPFYDNIMLFAAKNGMVGVNMTYRLAPANPYPAAPNDIAAALKWVTANIANHGGDPTKIFISGHSAGAAIAAQTITENQIPGLKGALLLSGIYSFTLTEPGKPELAYLGTDKAKHEAASSLSKLARGALPLFVAWAEIDPPSFIKQGEILYANLCIKNRCPSRVILKGHSHMSEVYSINTDDKILSDAILEFIRRNS
jgi:acetyl esterase/lipase